MQPPEPRVLFADRFDDPAFATRWTSVDLNLRGGPPAWSVRGGVLRQTVSCWGGGPHRGALLLARSEAPEPPWRLQVRVRSTDDDRVGVVFGFRGEDDHHLAWTREDQGVLAISRVGDGRETLLGTRSGGLQRHTWHTLRLDVDADRVTLGLDGQPTVVVPCTVGVGRVGLYCRANPGLEVSRFLLERPIGEGEPVRLHWLCEEVEGRQTVLRTTNLLDQPAWIEAVAVDHLGARVEVDWRRGWQGGGPWRLLAAGCTGTLVLGPPTTRDGHGMASLRWRTAAPPAGPPLLLTAWIEGPGGGRDLPLHTFPSRGT